MSKKGRK